MRSSTWDELARQLGGEETDHAALCEALAFVDEFPGEQLALEDAVLDMDTFPLEEELGCFSAPMDAELALDGLVLPEIVANSPVPSGGACADEVDVDPVSAQPAQDRVRKPETEESNDVVVKPPAVNRSRNRKREELLYLRGAVGELEERLATLKSRGQSDPTDDQRDAPVVVPPEISRMVASVWEDLATRQHRERQRAEGENAKLRRMLEDQIQVGKSLERLLKKRRNLELLELEPRNVRQRQTCPPRWHSTGIFDEFEAELPRIYANTVCGLRHPRFHQGEMSFRECRVKNDDDNGIQVEALESCVLPFDMLLTAREAWNGFMNLTDLDEFTYDAVEATDDTIKLQLTVSTLHRRVKGAFRVKMVVRQFVEADRVVIVWHGLADPLEVFDTPMDGLLMRITGWHVVQRLPKNPRATLLWTVSISVPEVQGLETANHQQKVGALTDFFLGSTDLHFDLRHQVLENRLLLAASESPQA